MRDVQVRSRLGDLLVERGFLDAPNLQRALDHQREWGTPLGRTLVEKRLCPAEIIWDTLALQRGLPFVRLDVESLGQAPLELLSPELAEAHQAIPLRLEGHAHEVLVVAFRAPVTRDALDAVRAACTKQVQPVLASDDDLERALALYRAPASAPGADSAAAEQPGAATEPPRTKHPSAGTRLVDSLRGWGSEVVSGLVRALSSEKAPERTEVLQPFPGHRTPRSVLVHGWPQPASSGMALLLASDGYSARVASEEEVLLAGPVDLVLLPLDEAERYARGATPLRAPIIVSTEVPEADLPRARALNALALLSEPLDAESLMRVVRRTLVPPPSA